MKKNILVIGGSGDIGAAIVSTFSNSCSVESTSRKELDLSSKESISSFLSNNKNIYNTVIFCAAENNPKSLADTQYEEILKTLQINLLSITEILHKLYCSDQIQNNGSIVILSSLYSIVGRLKRFPYSVSKHALDGLVKNLAIEMSQKKIRVNSVSPGYIDTKLTRRNLSDEEISKIEKLIPNGNLGKPHDIAEIVKFLSSENSIYINGQNIVADGGFICGGFMGLE